MAEFDITTEIFLGYHCSGSGEFTEGTGTVELTDEQVNQIVSLIKENNGETDIEKLALAKKYPDIFQTLDEAFRKMAIEAEYRYWLFECYNNGYCEEPDDFMESFEKEGLFLYEPGLDDEDIDEDSLEEAKYIAFREWLDEYVSSLDEDGMVAFILKHYGEDVVDKDEIEGNYQITIPQAIVDIATKED